MSTFYDFTVMLAGGHAYVLYLTDEAACQTLMEGIFKSTNEAPDKWLHLNDGERKGVVHPKAICGMYYRPHHKSQQEQILEFTQKMEKKLPDANEGEDWKHGDE